MPGDTGMSGIVIMYLSHMQIQSDSLVIYWNDQGGRTQHDFSLAWLEAAWYSSGSGHGTTQTNRTDTVKELPGYSVQNCPSVNFLFWGGAVGRWGIVYDIVWMGYPRRTPWTVLRTPVCLRILSMSFISVSIVSVCCYSSVSISVDTTSIRTDLYFLCKRGLEDMSFSYFLFKKG